jgi:cytochrome c peroxidase
MRYRFSFAAIFLSVLAIGAGLLVATAQQAGRAAEGEYQWNLPRGFPKPLVPADNLMSGVKVELGRYLFYDKRLSGNSTESCGTCHEQDLAFTDGKARAMGSTGELHPRGSMSLVNVAYAAVLTWSDPNERSLEHQALGPMFNKQPVELGTNEDDLISTIRSDPKYSKMFAVAFPQDSDPFTIDDVTKAIAAFERTIIAGNSPYDRYHYGGVPDAISESAKRGEVLFFSQSLSCFRCHSGFNFSDATTFEGHTLDKVPFHNTGLYNLSREFSYPSDNLGTYEHTSIPLDVGKFKVPTLRNIAITAPYMHDGSAKTLGEVLDHYAAGGRAITRGADIGDGSRNPNKDPLVHGFALTRENRADLIAFLNSLTDPGILHNSQFDDPWRR